MPTLNWIGKEKVVNHHVDVPFRVLEHQYGFHADAPNDSTPTDSGNKIIHGDNLEALKALLPEYEGRVDCIYIDPPYNTGESSWVYNDNVNDPTIEKWIGERVKEENIDLVRHDKWACMMYCRLILAYKMLSVTGTIFISIDDVEYANLKLICDEIFTRGGFVGTFIWEKRTNRENRKEVSVRHDYVLCYSKLKKSKDLRRLIKLDMSEKALANYKNPDNDPNGPWKSDPAHAQAGHGTENQFYSLIAPNGREHHLPSGRCWIYTQDKMQDEIDAGHIWFGSDGNAVPRVKTYLYAKERGLVPETMLFAPFASTNEKAKNDLKRMFGGNAVFETPKPYELILELLKMSTTKNSIIMDFFAGSGSTAHAVMVLNQRDGGHRHFILVELMDYADSLTAERVRRVARGYSYRGKEVEEIYAHKLTLSNLKNYTKYLEEAKAVTEARRAEFTKISKPIIKDDSIKVFGMHIYDGEMPGLGGSFDFYEVGEPLFMEDGMLNEAVDEEAIRRYVYYTETQRPLTRRRNGQDDYLLDMIQSTAYYFYYQRHETTILNRETLGQIVKEKQSQHIIYADVCHLEEEFMQTNHIIFKQIPRHIKRF